MKLKVTPLYILSFLCLTFLIHEVHDWAHALVARFVCDGWGPRIFDGWDFCAGCSVSSGERALPTIAGPIINFAMLWIGWSRLDPDSPTEDKSLGIALVFAALPWNMLLAAASGGGDLTSAIRFMQQHGPNSNHHWVSKWGFIITLILTVPPILRAFIQLPGYKGKLIIFPLMLLVPGWLDREVVGKLLNKWLIPPGTPQDHAYIWVLAWLVLVLAGWFFTRRKLEGLINELSL